MKGNGNLVNQMDKENKHLQKEIFMKDILKMGLKMVQESLLGQMD